MTSRELYDFCLSIGFPREASAFLADANEKLFSLPAASELIEGSIAEYAAGKDFSFSLRTERLAELSPTVGVHPYTSDMLFYLQLSPVLKEKYAEKGLPDEMFDGAMRDLLCKLYECREVFGIWGSFVAIWFARFFHFSLYTLGRLEFCLTNAPFDYEKDGLRIEKGQPCIDVHIPSCGKLVRGELEDSYRAAAAFFAPRLGTSPAFHCHSWLLFPWHREVLPTDSGIRRFAEDYDAVRPAEDEGDLWRIFGSADTEKPETLPEDTLLRRLYKARLIEGKEIGGGEGMFFLAHFKR